MASTERTEAFPVFPPQTSRKTIPVQARVLRLSVILGISATTLFILSYVAISILIRGEEDWSLGIALALCLLVSIAVSLIGAVLSLVCLCRSRSQRRFAAIALAFNCLPVATWLGLWIALQWRLR